MKKLLLALTVLTGLVLAPIAVTNVQKLAARAVSTETINPAYQQQALPSATNSLVSTTPKVSDIRKTLNLEAENTVVLKGPVTDDSVSATMKSLQEASRKLSKDTPILLVLDTPGGDIVAGMDLIDFAKALPQKVHTVNLFSASMGFQIAQGLNTRYIIRSGTLMSHRAQLGGLGGQLDGEFESRYNMIRRSVDYLDVIASGRMGIDLQTYRNKIRNEMWVYGFDAVEEKVADETVLVTCGASMNGSYKQTFNTMFGPVTVTFNKCPLIKAPEAIEMGQISIGEEAKVQSMIQMSIVNQEQFVREYITTDKFNKSFKLRLQ